ncbi:uncharacterized protein I303_102742 [Kwoniella dejecticola CBS 10117]|uniref:D-isomer specific 2-hydroxyacid dehydrogenase NAD-binding domain-containing protein n=1 Tax=Kwoniella dejecticola CBS 10117 TaxID=1296121 RepID=A0A1A6A9L5_9TREE|nr:uncharacterized protein I303_02757 [Kwoniella dejecticola CBS 10117]OBR86743.1 hypothetical protein I303_02757 [Kwoniella dejecticola CBS 10117]
MSTSIKVAILDDYNDLFPKYASDLPSNLDITVYRDTILPLPDPQPLIDRLKDYEVLVTMRERTPLPANIIESLPKLTLILTTGLRNRGIDIAAARKRGISVAGTPGPPTPAGTPYNFNATTQHTIALLLSLVSNIPRDHSILFSNPTSEWIHHVPLNTFLGGLTLGVLGLGKLGVGTARIASLVFGMKIIAWSPNLTQARADKAATDAGLPSGTFKAVSKDELFRSSDVISVHLVLGEGTRGIIGRSDLEKMKHTSFLITTSRGPLIDEDDLLDLLEKGRIKGAALDVFDVEPLPANSRWRTTKWGEDGRSQVVMTPHTGYSYEDSLEAMWQGTRENLIRIAEGKELKWVIDP